MEKIDRETYKRFFFFGIENKSEVIEGILSFSASEMYTKKYPELRECYDIPNEQFESEIIQGALSTYRQFYRFVILNDESNNDTFEVDEERLKEQLKKEMHQLRDEGKAMYARAGIYFVRDRMLKGEEKYIDGIGFKKEEVWTEQIYDILIQLEKLERENSQEYYETWMITRIARAVNRGEKEEALRLKKKYEQLRDRRDDEVR